MPLYETTQLIVSIITLIISLIVRIFVSTYLSDIAEKKGYNQRRYFWMCFFFGTIAYCITAALPDGRIEELTRRIDALEKIPSEDSLQNGNWLCTCGKVHASYITSCSCGATKRIVLENKSH